MEPLQWIKGTVAITLVVAGTYAARAVQADATGLQVVAALTLIAITGAMGTSLLLTARFRPIIVIPLISVAAAVTMTALVVGDPGDMDMADSILVSVLYSGGFGALGALSCLGLIEVVRRGMR